MDTLENVMENRLWRIARVVIPWKNIINNISADNLTLVDADWMYWLEIGEATPENDAPAYLTISLNTLSSSKPV